jgi:hypothetical protein
VSVSFSIVGERRHCDEFCDECFAQEVNLSNANAREFLAALDLDAIDLMGEARARDLIPALQRLAEAEPSPELASEIDGRYIVAGRQLGYLQMRAMQLLELCERAGELGVIGWA